MNISSSKTIGGSGGSDFTAAASGRIRGFHIRSGAWIDAVQVIYTNAQGQEDSTNRFGGQGGNLGTFMLEPDERVIAVSVSAGQYVNSITIRTSHGRSASFGHVGGAIETFIVPDHKEFAGFYGKCGAYVDSIGILLYDPSTFSGMEASLGF